MEKYLNVVSFDVPYPANYGGVIDVFYKIKALKKAGIKVILHCFEYGRNTQEELNKLAEEVHYYKRKKNPTQLLSGLPFIVKTRINQELKKNLLKNDYPILFEGLHTCYLIQDPDFKERKKIFRESNIEHEYYRKLAEVESNKLKKRFFLSEAKKLEKFEAVLENADKLLIVSKEETKYFKKKFTPSKVFYLPSFHENDSISSQKGFGKYILYNGKLSVPENESAAIFLINEVFSKISYPVIIAGMDPPKSILKSAEKFKNITIIANPSSADMHKLIQGAHLHCLYTHQATGLKLKLLNVLFQGRHVLVNRNMTTGTTFNEICFYAENPNEWIEEIEKIMRLEFTDIQLAKKTKELEPYQNHNQTKNLIKIIFD